MSRKKAKGQVKQLRNDLKAAKQSYASTVRAGNYRLLKLTLVMIILTALAAYLYGRVQL